MSDRDNIRKYGTREGYDEGRRESDRFGEEYREEDMRQPRSFSRRRANRNEARYGYREDYEDDYYSGYRRERRDPYREEREDAWDERRGYRDERIEPEPRRRWERFPEEGRSARGIDRFGDRFPMEERMVRADRFPQDEEEDRAELFPGDDQFRPEDRFADEEQAGREDRPEGEDLPERTGREDPGDREARSDRGDGGYDDRFDRDNGGYDDRFDRGSTDDFEEDFRRGESVNRYPRDAYEEAEREEASGRMEYPRREGRGNVRRMDEERGRYFREEPVQEVPLSREEVLLRAEEPARGSYGINESKLYEQIQQFKEKAFTLQEIINEKQNRVEYLEDVVAQMEEKNLGLIERLDKGQQDAGEFVAEIEEQIHRLEALFTSDMGDMEQRLVDHITEIPVQIPGDMQEINIDTQALTQGFEDHSRQVSETFEKISEKLDSIVVKQQNLNDHQDEMVGLQNDIIDRQRELIEQQRGLLDRDDEEESFNFEEVFSDQKSFLSNSMLSQEKKLEESLGNLDRQLADSVSELRTQVAESADGIGGIKNSLSLVSEQVSDSYNNLNHQIDGIRDEIFEKIHAEDVKVYRNLQDFMQQQDHHEEDEKSITEKYKSLRNREYIIIALVVINIILGALFLWVIS